MHDTYPEAVSSLAGWLSRRYPVFASGLTAKPSAEISGSLTGSGKTWTIKASSVIGTNSMKVAVWGDSNGQNDLKWYTLKSDGNGNFTATVDTTAHNEKGNFNFHAYGTFGSKQYFVAKTSVQI